MWAICTRCDPAEDIETFRRAWSELRQQVAEKFADVLKTIGA